MGIVTASNAVEQDAGVTVLSTGEMLPVIDTNNSTALQIEQWLHTVKDAVQHMTTIDELNQAEAMLTAVVKRLRQLDQDAAEAERTRILAFKRIGDLLGPAQRGGERNPLGSNQYAKVDNSQHLELSTPKPKQEQQRDWQARKERAA